jgi:hypothetical protein
MKLHLLWRADECLKYVMCCEKESAKSHLCTMVYDFQAVSLDNKVCFTNDEIKAALPLIRHMSDLLRTQAGDYECGGGQVDKPTMLFADLKQAVSNAVAVDTIEVRPRHQSGRSRILFQL